MTGMADLPCRALADVRVRFQPCGQDALSGRRALLARGAGIEIGEPREAVDRPLEWRRQPGDGRIVHLRDRRLDSVNEEMARAQGHPADPIAGQRVLDCRQQAQRGALAERRDQSGAGNAEAVGKADQPLAGAGLGYREIGHRQGPAGLDRTALPRRRLRHGQRFRRIGIERDRHRHSFRRRPFPRRKAALQRQPRLEQAFVHPEAPFKAAMLPA